MSDLEDQNKMRRTIQQEFGVLEDIFDETKRLRLELTNKVMDVARSMKLVDDHGNIMEDSDSRMKVITTATKLLAEAENASVKSITTKLRHSEQEMASAAATKERVALILTATAPGRREETFPTEKLEAQLAELFPDGDIKDFELRSNPNNLS